MAVLSTFRAPSLCRHVHHELLRSVLLDVTPKIPATACHQRHDVERYSRSMVRIHIMVATQARMCRFPSDGVGEATAIITTTDATADFATEDIRGIHGGIGE
jgi:hypothetical protein